MKKSGGMSTGMAIFIMICIMAFFEWLTEPFNLKCAHSGCGNEARGGSRYCYLHDTGSSHNNNSIGSLSGTKSTGSTSAIKTTGSTPSTESIGGSSGKSSSSTPKSTTPKSSSSTKKTYVTDTYDEGYEAVYLDGDYDLERYCNDDDYARGVDEAMDDWYEYGEDW